MADEIAEPESSSGAQHASDLPHRRWFIGEGAECALAQHGIERRIREGCEVLRVTNLEVEPAGEAIAFRRLPSSPDTCNAVVHADDLAAETPRQVQSRCAAARGQVQHAALAAKTEQQTQALGQLEPTGME